MGPQDMLPSTNDLRSHDRDQKRAVDAKQKWHRKWACEDWSRPCKVDLNGHETPLKNGPCRQKCKRRDKLVIARVLAKTKGTRNSGKAVVDDASDSSLDDTDLPAPTNSTHNVFEEMSFSTLQRTAHGQDVLQHAVDQALEKFEDLETTNLVKNEYEILDCSSEADEEDLALEDDDFELV